MRIYVTVTWICIIAALCYACALTRKVDLPDPPSRPVIVYPQKDWTCTQAGGSVCKTFCLCTEGV